jgi:hypothetical protein
LLFRHPEPQAKDLFMDANITTLSLALASVVGVAVFAQGFGGARRAYYMGISLWSRWLPVAATGVFLAVFAANLAAAGDASDSLLGLTGFFSVAEMVVLFLVGPLFLTRMGNVLAGATLAYCIERLLSGEAGPSGIGVYLVVGSATVVAVLADKMPWIGLGGTALAQKMREILLATLTIAALAIVFAATIKIHALSRWLNDSVHLAVPSSMLLMGMIAVFVGWLSIALGFTRQMTLPILALPTLAVTMYVTGMRGELLVVPFVLCLALSLATADRRLISRRRNAATTVLLPR